MADDVLSAAELKTLLEAKTSSAVPAGCSPARPAPPARQVQHPAAPPLCEELKRTVSAVGEDWARQAAAELSTALRRPVRLDLSAVSQVTFAEFAARLANPTCFNWLSAAPRRGQWMLEISPSILYPMIDRMLGGGRMPATIAARPLTQIELRLAGRVTRLLVHNLQAAWLPVVEVRLSIERVTSGAEASAGVDSADPIVWMRYEIAFEGARGMLNLGIPRSSLTTIAAEPAGAASPHSEDDAVEDVAPKSDASAAGEP